MHVVRRPCAQPDSCRDVANTGNGLRSLYGAERSQPVATGGKWSVSETAKSSETVADEITLLTYPVVVGQGTRLFPDTGPDMALDQVDSRAFPKGITLQVYRPTGRPQYAT